MGRYADRFKLGTAMWSERGIGMYDDPEVLAVMREWTDPEVVARSDVALDSGEYHGIDGMLQMFRSFDEVWSGMSYEVGEVIERGDELVAELRYRGRGASSGVPVAEAWWVHQRHRDGKLVLVEYLATREEAMKSAGLD